MLLLVGLGNPGTEYARTRHNVGFMTIERLAKRWGLARDRKRFQGITNEGEIAGEKIVALRPQTYMNESGRAVGAALRFFKLDPGDIVVFHDEADLAFGKVRWKTGGGSAGNNGIKSVIAHIGDGFHRVRIGVGKPEGERQTGAHVLSDFAKAETAELDKILDALAEAAELLAARDFERYMSRIALTLSPPRNAGPRPPPKAEDED